jgi:four helix bundle protein
MGKSPLKDKSFAFSLQVIAFVRALQEDKREFVISKQLLRSGTAIGAMIREAEFAESRADFAHKMNIALKEANETDYWLALLEATYGAEISIRIFELRSECRQIIAMLVASLKTVRREK